MDSDLNNTTIFLHIPKTAGTTLIQILRRQYSRNQSYFCGPNAQESARIYNQLTTAEKSEIRLITGHIGYGFHQNVPNKATYFTILRDPVERVISFYHFVRNNEQHYLNKPAVEGYRGIKDFIESGITTMVDNGQTRLISGVWLEPGFGQCSEKTLELAKRNLREHFSVVGFTEEFDATLLLLMDTFNWRNIYYVRRNVTKNRPAASALTTEEYQAVTAVNQLDIALYQYAQTLFAEKIALSGSDFPHRLKTFQRNNRRYNKFIRPFVDLQQQIRSTSVRTAFRQWRNKS